MSTGRRQIVDSIGRPARKPRETVLLADQATEMIRSMVAEGRLAPGDRVNELELAEALGISRGPVREAVRRLVSTGLLAPEPNLGSRVIALDRDYVYELYMVREALEALAARQAAERMSDAERQGLVRALDRHEALMAERRSGTYSHGRTDWDFHLLIMKGARNPLVWRICGSDLRDIFSLLRAQHGGGSTDRAHRALQEHRWIADAIAAGDADLAAAHMARHVRASRDNLLAKMDSRTKKSA